MARAFTLSQLITRALQLADMENSQFIGSSIATTIASGSNGQSLPQSTINIASSTGFNPNGGTAAIAATPGLTFVGYTGVGSGTLTGCTGGSGTLATGQAVTFMSETIDAINAGIAYVWGELIRVSPDQYSSDFDISTIAGTLAYPLPKDFLRLAALYSIEESDGSRRPIQNINLFSRAYYRAPQAVYSLVLDYIPTAVTLVNASDTFDGVCGYEEIVSAHAARRFLQKEESDVSVVQGIISEWRASLGQNFRSSTGPKFMTDVDAYDARIYPTTIGVRGYRLRGSNAMPIIELYEPVLPLVVLPS